MAEVSVMDKLVSLAKRRGFVFQSSEVYGGLGSVWDYGPLGVELKRNIKDRWWQALVHGREDIEGLDAGILMHPKVWEASGHVSGFSDPLIDCRTCKARFRADKLADARCPQKPSKLPGEHSACDLTEPRQFNLMFKTFMGPVEESAAAIYLRPETAQGSYVNFLNVLNSSRQKIPFGIAQIGKAFRNEITPGNFIFRTREFEQMEMQFFVKPGTDEEWFEQWREIRMAWHVGLGLNPAKLRWHQHGPGELAHYAKAAYDIEYEFSFGWQEVEGVHNRTDFDLRRHQEFSGKKLEYFEQATNEHYLPYRHRNSDRRGPGHPDGDGRRLPGGDGGWRNSSRNGIPAFHRPHQGSDTSTGQEGRHAGTRSRTVSRRAKSGSGVLRRCRCDRPALPAAG